MTVLAITAAVFLGLILLSLWDTHCLIRGE